MLDPADDSMHFNMEFLNEINSIKNNIRFISCVEKWHVYRDKNVFVNVEEKLTRYQPKTSFQIFWKLKFFLKVQ